MKWSQLKKKIESRLSETVQGRVELGCTSYRKSHDELGRGWIAIDKNEIINMSSIKFEIEFGKRRLDYQDNYNELAKELHEKNIFAQWDWIKSLSEYLNLSIDEIMNSENSIIRSIGMLDARIGKRRLQKMDMSNEHDLVKRLYYLRCDAETLSNRINIPENNNLTSKIDCLWSRKQDNEEKEKHNKAISKLDQAKKTRKLRILISAIYRKEIPKDQLDTPISKEIYNGFEQTSNSDTLRDTLLFLESKSKLLKTVKHVRGVIALTNQATHWLRPIEEWIPLSHNPDRQFSALARYLWAVYDVPLFMDNAWFNENPQQQDWFKYIGEGKNIRNAEQLPIPLTKKMAHFFLQAPASYSIEAAFRWAQVHALDGNKYLADLLLETRLIRDFRDNDFWLSVIRFFIRNPMLDPVYLNPIIDYIWYQRYELRLVFLERGIAEEVGPEQPNFTMAGRTVQSLLRAVEEWHKRLGKETKSGRLQWKKSVFQDFKFVEGNKKSKNMKVWRIRELLTSQELIAEGRQLRHCVSTYVNSCHSGFCSIWTMELETEDGIDKLLTIEVYNSTKQIRQVRGKYNRRSTEKEKEIIERWALQEGIEIMMYVFG